MILVGRDDRCTSTDQWAKVGPQEWSFGPLLSSSVTKQNRPTASITGKRGDTDIAHCFVSQRPTYGLVHLLTRLQVRYLSSVDPVSSTSVPHATTTQRTSGKISTSSKRRNLSAITFAYIDSDARKPSHWRSCPSDRMMSARPRTDAVGNASVLSFGRLRHLASNQDALPKWIARIVDLSG